MVAFQDVAQNLTNMSKYQSNPKVMNLISELSANLKLKLNARLTKPLLKETNLGQLMIFQHKK
jgi:hypothetical protein